VVCRRDERPLLSLAVKHDGPCWVPPSVAPVEDALGYPARSAGEPAVLLA
jgi:hypothetical protein